VSDRVTALILNVLGRMDVASVITAATLVRAGVSFNGRADSERLPGETAAEHERWLRTWQLVETNLKGLHGFPLWLKDVHNMLHAGVHDIAHVFKHLLRDSSEFELDFGAFQTWAREMASKMPGGAADADAAGMAQVVFATATNTIAGLPRLTFQAFLAALPRLAFALSNPKFGELSEHPDESGVVRAPKVQPVQWALLALLDAMEVQASHPSGAGPRNASPDSIKVQKYREAGMRFASPRSPLERSALRAANNVTRSPTRGRGDSASPVQR